MSEENDIIIKNICWQFHKELRWADIYNNLWGIINNMSDENYFNLATIMQRVVLENSRPIEDQLKAENERLIGKFREIAKASGKYKVEGDEDGNNNYWEWTDNGLDIIIEIDNIIKQALNEVTK